MRQKPMREKKLSRSQGYDYLTQQQVGMIELAAQSYKGVILARKKRMSSERIKNAAATLDQAKELLMRTAAAADPLLDCGALFAGDEETKERILCAATRFGTAISVLDEIKQFLLASLKAGREPDLILGGCAKNLASWFNAKTTDDHWKWVGEILADKFPDALKPDDRGLPGDEIKRDLAVWAYNLVKHFDSKLADPQRRKKMIEQQRRDLITYQHSLPRPAEKMALVSKKVLDVIFS